MIEEEELSYISSYQTLTEAKKFEDLLTYVKAWKICWRLAPVALKLLKIISCTIILYCKYLAKSSTILVNFLSRLRWPLRPPGWCSAITCLMAGHPVSSCFWLLVKPWVCLSCIGTSAWSLKWPVIEVHFLVIINYFAANNWNLRHCSWPTPIGRPPICQIEWIN